MIASILNDLSDTLFKVRAGRITYSLPARRLYRIAPYEELSGAVVYAVPLDVYTHGQQGVTLSRAYQWGEDVLYIERATASSSSGLLFGVILGVIPAGVVNTDPKAIEELVKSAEAAEMRINPAWGNELADELARTLQIAEMQEARTFENAHSHSELFGDYSISGKNTAIHVSDFITDLKAGKAHVRLNSMFDMLDVLAPLYRKASAGSYEQLYRMNDSFFNLVAKGLHAYESYSKGTIPIYRYLDEFSAYKYGKRNSIVDTEGKELSAVQQTMDGKTVISGVNGAKLEKTIIFRKAVLPKDKPITYADTLSLDDIKTEEELDGILSDKEVWDIPEAELDEPAEVLPMPSVEEGINLNIAHTEFFDGVLNKPKNYTKTKAVIRHLPTGGILLRDAWGSEIRMEGGNIQISAANNIINVAGRDALTTASGVVTTNAGTGIQSASVSGEVVVSAESGVIMNTNKGAVRIKGNATSLETKLVNADLDVLRVKAKTTVLGGDVLCADAKTASMHATSLSLSGSGSAVVLSDGIVVGASGIAVHGSVSVRKSRFDFSGIPKIDGTSVNITVPASQASLSVSGSLIVGGSASVADSVVVARGVYAKVAATHAPGLGKLKTAPKASEPSEEEFSYKLTSISNALEKIVKYFDEIKSKSVFRLVSTAFTIWQPLFAKVRGKSKTPIAQDEDKNYIYPGKNFWLEDGMLLQDDAQEESYDPDYEYVSTGANSLMLGEANSKEETV